MRRVGRAPSSQFSRMKTHRSQVIRTPSTGDAPQPSLRPLRPIRNIARFATLNVGTLTGRSRELSDLLKRRRIDIACIQETKWKGAKSRDIGEGYKLFYHGITSSRNGVALAVSENLRDSITAVDRISDRLMSIRIATGTTTAHVISCYAPQPGCAAEERDRFWTQLESHVGTIDANEPLFIGGDLNGHVGESRNGFDRIHGGYGYGTRNEGGDQVLEFAEACDLAVTNTFFKKRPSHLITYSSGGHCTQIDYWMVRRRDLRQVMDTKVIPSDNVAPQHKLLVLDFNLHLRPPIILTTTNRIKWWKLPSHVESFVNTLGPIETNLGYSSKATWEETTRQIREAGSKTLGKTKPGRRYVDKQIWWWNDNVQCAIKAKKAAFKKWLKTKADADFAIYHQLKSTAKREVTTAKADHIQDLYERLNTREGANDVYRLARSRHQATVDIGQVMHIKDTQGVLLRKPEDVLKRWREHFDLICNEEFPHPPISEASPIQGAVPQITIAEVEAAIHFMKNGKATGPDDIPSEAWKKMGPCGAEFLSNFFNKCIEENEIPTTWKTSVTIPIWKGKGDVTNCSNYRPIRLLCHSMKIFERVLDARLRGIVEISTNQCGFVKGCGTTDAIHAARLLMERHREKRKTIHMAFLDLEKAFDRVPHNLIWYSLRSHGVPEIYIRWIRLLYSNATSSIRCPVGVSEPFDIRVGVHQGSALSPLLFILCMDTVTADLQTPHPWSLLYADDVMLASETRNELEQQVNRWKTRLDEYGMRLNLTKTEYLECGLQVDGTIKVNGVQLGKTTEFRYLGSRLVSDGDSIPDARARVNATWMKWRQVTGILCDRKMPLHLKSKIYRTVVRPVALYGSECWPTTRTHEQMLHTMEMRMLRWSLGVTKLDHVTNEHVRESLGVAPIEEKMRESRLRWYGHVLRANTQSVARRAYDLNPDGRRPQGRPKKRWLDTIKEDMRAVGVKPEDANNRVVWRAMCKSADPAIAGQTQRR